MTGDFEIHPAGTAERLRRLAIIGPAAADLLDEESQLIFELETVDGEFDPANPCSCSAKETYETMKTLAAHLRALCGAASGAGHG